MNITEGAIFEEFENEVEETFGDDGQRSFVLQSVNSNDEVDESLGSEEDRRHDHLRKLKELREVLQKKNVPSVLITSIHNFSWLTSGGRNYISLSARSTAASLFVDSERIVLLTNNVEFERISEEELAVLGKVQIFCKPWFWDDSANLTRIMTLGRGSMPQSDTGQILSSCFDSLRHGLSEYEVAQYRMLGRDCGQAFLDVSKKLARGLTERQVAGFLASACYEKGIEPIFIMVAGDSRMDSRRHRFPSGECIKERVMMGLCGRRRGLIASLTRTAHFGNFPSQEELMKKHEDITYVDAVAHHRTRPGATAVEVLDAIKEAYAFRGMKDEWQFHHQGGATGYMTREWVAKPGLGHGIRECQAFAWNPCSIGVKSEDTILVSDKFDAPEVLTLTPTWPMIEHLLDGKSYLRPGILVI